MTVGSKRALMTCCGTVERDRPIRSANTESLPEFGIGMTMDDFQIKGIRQDVTESL